MTRTSRAGFVQGRASNEKLIIVALASLGVIVLVTLLAVRRGPWSVDPGRSGFPIVLIHGLGGSAESWIESGYVEYLEGLGLRYGGVVRAEKGGHAEISGGRVSPEEGGVFVFEVSDPWASLDLWQREIRSAVLAVTERTEMPKVILVGFSAGGVAARKYLVEHLEDHRVARLVTVSSPNAGSELAVAAELQREVGRLPLGRAAADLLESWERKRGLRPDSPLLEELLPPANGNYLDVLNKSRHPEDVEYACVIATGTEMGRDWKRLQVASAQTRDGKIAGSFLEKLSTGVMQLLAWNTNNESRAGDGAVLIASQHLAGVEFFRRHPGLVRKIVVVEGGHGQAEHRYRALTEAIGDSVKFLRAREERRKGGELIVVDFRSPLAGLGELAAMDGQGRPLTVGSTRLFRRGDEVFARVDVGPITVPTREVRLRFRAPDAPLARGVDLLSGSQSVRARVDSPRAFDMTVHSVIGAGRGTRGRAEGGSAELQAVLFVNDREVFRTARVPDVTNFLPLEQHGRVILDPRRSLVKLSLWNMTGLGIVPDPVGSVVWKPGELASGRALVATDTGIDVDVELQPAGGDRTLWSETPLSW